MFDYGIIEKSFGFLVIEVIEQVEKTSAYLDDPVGKEDYRCEIRNRDDYIDHLKGIIESKSYAFLRSREDVDKKTGDRLRSLNIVTNNLERIADHCVSIVVQVDHLTHPLFICKYDFKPFFDVVIGNLELVVDAMKDGSYRTAADICESEPRLDEMYSEKFRKLCSEMSSGPSPGDLVTALFVYQYLERMGDCLLNIGEAIILSRIGDRLKFHHFETIRETVGIAGEREKDLTEIDYQGFWESKSGCRIGKVTEREREAGRDKRVVVKEGDERKIKRERENIEHWNSVLPGLPPRVVDYSENLRNAALVVEYLEGRNLQELVLDMEDSVVDDAMEKVKETVRTIWDKTWMEQHFSMGFLSQMDARLDEVYRVHPYFKYDGKTNGRLRLPVFNELLKENMDLDECLRAPFSVFGHGDFNLDNVIYDSNGGKVHFVDVHRSSRMDYTQDVAVFLVSGFRLPVVETRFRKRLERVIESFFRFAAEYAGLRDDATFQPRLALGIVRSLVTSTRFELDRKFAENMIWRASYLLEKVVNGKVDRWDGFSIPLDVLFI